MELVNIVSMVMKVQWIWAAHFQLFLLTDVKQVLREICFLFLSFQLTPSTLLPRSSFLVQFNIIPVSPKITQSAHEAASRYNKECNKECSKACGEVWDRSLKQKKQHIIKEKIKWMDQRRNGIEERKARKWVIDFISPTKLRPNCRKVCLGIRGYNFNDLSLAVCENQAGETPHLPGLVSSINPSAIRQEAL